MSKNAKEIAVLIVAKLDSDKKFAKSVHASNEFYRAMMYESQLVENVAEIDGTDEYHAIVDELVNLL